MTGSPGGHPASPEGWEWVRIQTEPCPQCGQHPGVLPPAALGEPALVSAANWAEFLAAAGDTYLRTGPAPGVWSPLQYGAHVRDMLRVFGDRILAAVAEDNPTVAWFDPGSDGWASYNQLEPTALAADLRAQAERLAGIIGDRRPADWARTAMRDGVDRFTVAGLACFGIHEAHHHLLDARGALSG